MGSRLDTVGRLFREGLRGPSVMHVNKLILGEPDDIPDQSV